MIHICCNDMHGNFSERAQSVQIYSAKNPNDHIVGFECKYHDAFPRFTYLDRNLRLCRITLRAIHQTNGVGNVYWNAWNIPSFDAAKLLTATWFRTWFDIESGDSAVFEAWRAMIGEPVSDVTP